MSNKIINSKVDKIVSLKECSAGTCVQIVNLSKVKEKSRLIQLGLLEGEIVQCLEHLPGGTVVVRKGKREIAIGAKLAQSILVKPVDGQCNRKRKRWRLRFGFMKFI